MLDSSYQGVKRFSALSYSNTDADANRVVPDSFKKYFLPKTSKLMEEIFIINQLMTQLGNAMMSEKYQHEKIMIKQLVVY